jgi:hypothetical protein
MRGLHINVCLQLCLKVSELHTDFHLVDHDHFAALYCHVLDPSVFR